MNYITAPYVVQTLISILYFSLIIFSLCIAFLCSHHKHKYVFIITESMITIFFSILLIGCLTYFDIDDISKLDPVSTFAVSIPVSIDFLLLSLFTLLNLFITIVLIRNRKNTISKMSIKEAFDDLPCGICFYEASGVTRLVNSKRNDFSIRITGEYLLNGKKFISILTDENIKRNNLSHQEEEEYIISLDDHVYSFRSREHQLSDKSLYEIIATDITRKHQLSRELNKKNKELSSFNKRMREYGETIEELTIEKETLSAKRNIHDKLGKLLILSRQSLDKDRTEEEKEVLLSTWKNTLIAFESMKENESNDTYDELFKAAKDIGISVIFSGRRPESRKGKKIAAKAIIECMTNTIKHAKGNEVYVSFKERNRFIEIQITNNGEQPKEEIKEGGGLSSLRLLIEREGGSMKIISFPRFEMNITIEKGEEYDR
ncbi:MAG: hypothetical protein SOX24_02010 [Candidatus Enterosoma sp.]|nr:hypothetical protein [Candidatus Enterosoma sp.]